MAGRLERLVQLDAFKHARPPCSCGAFYVDMRPCFFIVAQFIVSQISGFNMLQLVHQFGDGVLLTVRRTYSTTTVFW